MGAVGSPGTVMCHLNQKTQWDSARVVLKHGGHESPLCFICQPAGGKHASSWKLTSTVGKGNGRGLRGTNLGDEGSIPGSGRSAGAGNGNLLQYSCLENPMDRGAWQATVHGVTKSRPRLSD